MINDFNAAFGHKYVNLELKMPSTEKEYETEEANADYDITYALYGWGADYADPTSYLSIIDKKGDMLKRYGLDKDEELKVKILGDYSRLLEEANFIEDPDERLKALAKVEHYLVFEEALLIPNAVLRGDRILISRFVPFTKPTVDFGSSSSKNKYSEKVEDGGTMKREDREKLEAAYEIAREEARKNAKYVA